MTMVIDASVGCYAGSIMDIHSAVKTLTAAGADEALAVAVVDVARSAAADRGRELVTNADLTAHRAEVRADLTALELRLSKWIAGTGVAVAGAILAGLRLLLN